MKNGCNKSCLELQRGQAIYRKCKEHIYKQRKEIGCTKNNNKQPRVECGVCINKNVENIYVE